MISCEKTDVLAGCGMKASTTSKRSTSQARITEKLKKSGQSYESDDVTAEATTRSRRCNGPPCLTPYITTVRGETRDFLRILKDNNLNS